MLILPLLACLHPDSGIPLDSTDTTDSGTDACPGLDCRDQLDLLVLGVDGSPSDGFGGTLSWTDADPVAFNCWDDTSAFDGGMCLGDGGVRFWTYAASYALSVFEGDDAPWWAGTLTPSWTAPYDSEECGHYCWMAEEVVQLEPCEGCG